MARYILRGLAESVVVLAVMWFVIYALIGLMPGDPIDLMLSADPHLTPALASQPVLSPFARLPRIATLHHHESSATPPVVPSRGK